MHGQVGAVGGTFEVAVLLGTRLRRLLAQELEIRALLGGESLAEAFEGRLAGLLATQTSASRSPSERSRRASESAG